MSRSTVYSKPPIVSPTPCSLSIAVSPSSPPIVISPPSPHRHLPIHFFITVSPALSSHRRLSVVISTPPLAPHRHHPITSILSMALPFIPVHPEQVAINIANKMGFIRQGLMSRGEYLADPTLPERVGWEPYGRGQRLVVLPPPSPSPSTREATPLPDSSDAVAANPSDDSSPTPDESDASSDEPTKESVPAVLTIVTKLVPGESWLYPDGRWTGPTRYVRKFTDLKLLCTGGPPAHPRFVNDYAASIANLNSIMGRIEDSRNERNAIVSGPGNHIRARHQLFTVCSI